MLIKNLFISRKLKENSPFRQALKGSAVSIIDESLVIFQPISFNDFPATDWLFFYSKNGVKYFLEQLEEQQLTQLPKIATIGRGTAEFLQQAYNLKVDFIGLGNPLETATAFNKIIANQSILFLQAKHSKQSIQKLLPTTIPTQSLVVYDNIPNQKFNIPLVDILVFTSPLNALTYFGRYTLQPSQKVVAIGTSTQDTLHQIGVTDLILADTPHEQSLATACLKIINSPK